MQAEMTEQLRNLEPGDHLCLFYDNDPAEQMPALLPFIQHGLARDEQFIYIADDQTVQELARRLEEGGIDVETETRHGRLKLWTRNERRQPGQLDSDKKAQQVRNFVSEAARSGFKGVRFAVEMTWTLGPDIDPHRLEHWEATINTLFEPSFPARIICQYNRSRLAPETLVVALHTHPQAILGSEVYPNVFYQAPLILTQNGNGHNSHKGHRSANGHSDRNGNGKSSLARLNWMLSQLHQAREAQKHRDEIIRQRAALTAARRTEDSLRALKDELERELAERKRAERELHANQAALHANERYLRTIIESSPECIKIIASDGTVLSMNRAGLRMLGADTPAQIIGQKVYGVIAPEDRARFSAMIDRVNAGEQQRLEFQIVSLNGTRRWMETTASPIPNPNGPGYLHLALTRDVSERKQADFHQQLLYDLVAAVNSAAALPEVYDVALDTICRSQDADRASILLYDDDGVMRFKASRGLSEEYRLAVEGHSPWQCDVPDSQPVCIEDVAKADFEPNLRSAIEREGIGALAFVPITFEKRLLGKFMVYYNSPHAFTEVGIRYLQTIAGQVAFAIERQNTERSLERLVEQRTASLREAIAQMEEFSYSISHDLRGPVRAMKGFARALLEDYGERLDDIGKDYLDRIVRGGTRMDRLIQDVLTYTRLSRRELQLQPVNLDKLVRDILDQYPDMQPPRAEVLVREELPAVTAHEPSLSQAISNLLCNAVKFVPTGETPQVTVRAEIRGEHVRLWIEDNGIGIKPEYQHRIFGMFERIHPDHKYEGTGIGLAIVRRAAERMGGSVGVESDGFTGSKFWIELRAAEKS